MTLVSLCIEIMYDNRSSENMKHSLTLSLAAVVFKCNHYSGRPVSPNELKMHAIRFFFVST